jgi:uncharacterized protein YbjT (DUF2867 family)
LATLKVTPTEVVTDAAPVYPRVLDELVPAAWHHVEQYENNRIEADHGRLKHRLRSMPGFTNRPHRDSHHHRTRIHAKGTVASVDCGSAGWRREAFDSPASGISFAVSVRGFPVSRRGDHGRGALVPAVRALVP